LVVWRTNSNQDDQYRISVVVGETL